MPSKRYSTEEILDAIRFYGGRRAAAQALGMKADTLDKRVQRLKSSDDPYPIIQGKSILYDAESGDPKLVWSTGKGVNALTAEEVADAVHDTLKDYKPPAPFKTSLRGNKELMGFWPLPDLHMGLRAWRPETGQDWDISIAGNRFRKAIEALGGIIPQTKKALVLGIGDLLHADNYHYGTTNPNTHHVVDADGRYPKMLKEAAEIVIHTISIARQRADEVDVAILRGNHDGASAVGIELALYYYFRNDKKINVILNPDKHFVTEWGSVMLFSTHGDTLKFKNVSGYASDHHAEIWGRTRQRLAFTGHYHYEKVVEQPGMTVEILQSPAAPDAWTTEQGFCSGRSMQARVFSKERGEVARFKEPVL